MADELISNAYFSPRSIGKKSLDGITADFFGGGSDLLARWRMHASWWEDRLENGVDPYGKTTASRIGTKTIAKLRDGTTYSGVNFAS